jgi:hypothetical protein
MLLSSLFAAENKEQLSFIFEGKESKIQMSYYLDAQVNSDCLEKKSYCLAIKAFSGDSKKLKMDSSGSPALSYCKSVSATPVLLKNKGNEEVGFCLFDDLSLIRAWDLFSKHAGKK